MNAHKNKRKFGHLQLYQDEWTKNTNIPDKQTKKTYILLLYHTFTTCKCTYNSLVPSTQKKTEFMIENYFSSFLFIFYNYLSLLPTPLNTKHSYLLHHHSALQFFHQCFV